MRKKDVNLYPAGLDHKKVKEIIAYYDAKQDASLEELEQEQRRASPTTFVEVPSKLVPEVKKLIAKRSKRSA